MIIGTFTRLAFTVMVSYVGAYSDKVGIFTMYNLTYSKAYSTFGTQAHTIATCQVLLYSATHMYLSRILLVD